IAGAVFGEQAARNELVEEIKDTIGPDSAVAIQNMIKQANDSGAGLAATIIGIVTLLLGASGVFGQLQDPLNTTWKVAPQPGRGVWGVIRDRFLSFTMVLGMGFLLLVSLTLSALLAALGKYLTPDALPGGLLLWQAVNTALSFLLYALLFAMIFKVLP